MSTRSRLGLNIGIVIASIVTFNAIRINAGEAEDKKIIYKSVQEKLESNYKKDFIAIGSPMGFSKEYSLRYIDELNAYEFQYTEPEMCIDLELLNHKKQNKKDISIKDLIEKCESEDKMLIY